MSGAPRSAGKRARLRRRGSAPSGYCRWVDVVGCDRAELEQVCRRLGLPARLVPLSRVEHLYPVVRRLPAAWFLVTCFTAPSRARVFTREPLYFWLTDSAIVTISPRARRRSVLAETAELGETRDDFLIRVAEAAVSSHEDVGRHLHDSFRTEPADRRERPRVWHDKERRLALFGRLLEHQLDFLCALGTAQPKVRQLHAQLAGLVQIVHYAYRELRRSGHCPICRPAATPGLRRGH